MYLTSVKSLPPYLVNQCLTDCQLMDWVVTCSEKVYINTEDCAVGEAGWGEREKEERERRERESLCIPVPKTTHKDYKSCKCAKAYHVYPKRKRQGEGMKL